VTQEVLTGGVEKLAGLGLKDRVLVVRYVPAAPAPGAPAAPAAGPRAGNALRTWARGIQKLVASQSPAAMIVVVPDEAKDQWERVAFPFTRGAYALDPDGTAEQRIDPPGRPLLYVRESVVSATASDAPRDDELEELWKTYYANVFNPARIKLKAIRMEMPALYVARMPETLLIPELVRDAQRLFDADATRRAYRSGSGEFVVSPENSRQRLSAFIRGARRQLLIYDPRLSDKAIHRLLTERVEAGVDVRIIGKMRRLRSSLRVEKFPGFRLHVRAIIRDGQRVTVDGAAGTVVLG
jgi:hypothetical protein